MLTVEQIRTLNDARTILREAKHEHTWEGGFAKSSYEDAENAVFQALNVTRSYLGQPISDDLMHNREDDPVRSLGRAYFVSVESDEDGFELHLVTDSGRYVINIHGCSMNLMNQVDTQIRPYWDEAEAARVSSPLRDDGDGYDTSDPKHPDWHSVHVDLYDSREGK